jgi:hypothetical protein
MGWGSGEEGGRSPRLQYTPPVVGSSRSSFIRVSSGLNPGGLGFPRITECVCPPTQEAAIPQGEQPGERVRSSRISPRSIVFRLAIPLLLLGMFLLMAILIGVAASVLLGLVPWT